MTHFTHIIVNLKIKNSYITKLYKIDYQFNKQRLRLFCCFRDGYFLTSHRLGYIL